MSWPTLTIVGGCILLVGLLSWDALHAKQIETKQPRWFFSRGARPLARVVSAILEPAYFWLGWMDPEGNPANSKIVYTCAAAAALYMMTKIGLRMIEKAMEVTWPFVALVVLVLAFCGSLDYFKKLLHLLAGRWRGQAPNAAPPANGG